MTVRGDPAHEPPPATVHGNPLPWILSLLLHGALAVVLLILPAQANQPRLQTLELVERPPPPPPPPPPPETKTEPPEPPPKFVAMQRVLRPQRPEPPPPPAEPIEPAPPKPSPPETAPPPSFGLKLSGTATAAPGQGVQVPEGDTLRTSPTQRRPKDKKGEPARGPVGRPGFRKVYGKGEDAPLAVATTMPTLLKKEIPPYPEKAKELGIEGRVVLELTVNDEGKVIAVRVVTRLHPLLNAAATKAARKMRFAPGTVNGTPVTLKIPVPFTFVLD